MLAWRERGTHQPLEVNPAMNIFFSTIGDGGVHHPVLKPKTVRVILAMNVFDDCTSDDASSNTTTA